MSLRERVRRFFTLGDDAEPVERDCENDAVREGRLEIERARISKQALRSKLEPTGFLPGDAIIGRRRVNPKAVRRS